MPATLVCTEYTGEVVRGWIDAGATLVQEITTLSEVTYVDLPTGHWPQLTRPGDLARIIMACARPPRHWPVRIDEHGRIEPPDAGDEVTTLLGFLDYQRSTVAWKCTGVDAAGARASVGASDLTLGSLVKHLALVEESWFQERFAGERLCPPFDGVDWDADPDWDFHSAARDDPDEIAALWHSAVDRSRRRVDTAIAAGGLDQLATGFPAGADHVPSLRWIIVHMIEEYARHLGHADLIRAHVDGLVGE